MPLERVVMPLPARTTVPNFTSGKHRTSFPGRWPEGVNGRLTRRGFLGGAAAAATIAGIGLGSTRRSFASPVEIVSPSAGQGDDAAAIQRVIDAGRPYHQFATTGRQIVLGPGRFVLSRPIDLKSCHGVHIEGAGIQATELIANGPFPVFVASGGPKEPLNKASIARMTITGGGKTYDGAHGISLAWSNHCAVRDVILFGCRVGVHVAHAWQLDLASITVSGAGRQQSFIGIYLDESSAQYVDNAVVANGIYLRTEDCGFRIVNGQGSKFVNCEAGGSRIGWHLGDTTGALPCEWMHITNCLSDSTSGPTWLLRAGAAPYIGQIQFGNCWSGNSGEYGMVLEKAKGVIANGMQMSGHRHGGVHLRNSRECIISASSLRENNRYNKPDYADILLSDSSHNVIQGNISKPAGTASKSVREEGTSDYNLFSGNVGFQGADIIGAHSSDQANIWSPQ